MCIEIYGYMYRWTMLHKLSVDCFKWVENICKFTKDSIQNYNKDGDKRYFLRIDV